MRPLIGAALIALGASLGVAALGVADAGAERDPAEAAGLGFEMRASRVAPRHPLFDARRKITLRYRFAASRPTDLRITAIEVRSGRTVAAWRERGARPGSRLRRDWNGVDRRGRAVRDGDYEFRVGPVGRQDRYAGRFELHGHVYPVAGSHGSRGPVGEFGAGRNGGRVHEGYDILADCGTPLVAARGGRVRKAGYDARLYGYFVLISGRKSDEQYFYSHLVAPSPVDDGERIHTGDRVGKVGQTGNAASTPCHLHFELRRSGRPVDPEPELRRWDRWS